MEEAGLRGKMVKSEGIGCYLDMRGENQVKKTPRFLAWRRKTGTRSSISVGEWVGNMSFVFQHLKVERLGQQWEV